MVLSICFDVMGTCFSLDILVRAVDEMLGDELRAAGSGPRATVMDWFHSAQRDYTYLSITSPPPPSISEILLLTLPRSLNFALSKDPSLADGHLPPLRSITDTLSSLSPSPGLVEAFHLLKACKKGSQNEVEFESGRPHNASLEVELTSCSPLATRGENNSNGLNLGNLPPCNLLLVTNGSEGSTKGWAERAGILHLVDKILSCDEVGCSKPFGKVYDHAMKACDHLEGVQDEERRFSGDRWFVAAHMWDLHAARKAGFKTALVLSEQPPLVDDELERWWKMWGGEPDLNGKDLEEVAKQILSRNRKYDS